MKRWIGLCFVIVGIVLVLIGAYNWRALIAAPVEAQRAYLAQTVLPLIVGLWIFIGGVYSLVR